ncbi:MFS transporter [Kineothrix alysoides]|uniref:MFS transporter n=1 Tax=Kineothrix alysoides TaxID=1469948 RepID=A0A4R1QW87_9FIRM|nr:MFS transporter [Kineothrix alysoides]TCL57531.1 MFS transporter [Kineothrix alysoides]
MQDNMIYTPSPKNFNLMVLGQIISIFGAALLRFALSLYVLDTTGNESMFAALYAISNIPLLLAPVGGAIADRFNRRNLMVIFDFTSSAFVLCLILLMGAGNHSVLMIGVIMVALSVISALYTPAVTASIPLLVAKEKLEGANGIVQAVQALSGVVAPILGGVLYSGFGVHNLLVMSCAAFFLSAVMEIFIQIPFSKRERDGLMAAMIFKDIKEGFAYVIKKRFILKAVILAAILNFILVPLFIVGAPIILRVTMRSSDSAYGLGMGMIQFSTILGALTVGLFSKRMKVKTLHRWSLVITMLLVPMALSVTTFMLGLGYYPSFILFMVCGVPIAAAVTIISIFIVTKVQKKTPDELLGKVMAIMMAVAQCAAPLGQIMYGNLFKTFRETPYIPILAAVSAMLAITFIMRQMLKNEGGTA